MFAFLKVFLFIFKVFGKEVFLQFLLGFTPLKIS